MAVGKKKERKQVLPVIIGAVVIVAFLAFYFPSYLADRISARIIVDNRTRVVGVHSGAIPNSIYDLVDVIITDSTVEIETPLLFENKAFMPLSFKRVSCSIFLEDEGGNLTQMAEGFVSNGVKVPAKGSALTLTRLFVYREGAYLVAWEWLTGFMARKGDGKKFGIRINGTADFDLGIFGSFPAKFAANQTIP